MQRGLKMSVLNQAHFKDETAAYAFVEARVWPKGRICPHCGTVDQSGSLKGKSTRVGLYKCYACRKPFTVKIGTIFEASHIPMHIWLQAMALLCSSKKGMSANQLHRILGVTLKSAWFMAHRIRTAMAPDGSMSLGGKGQIVEADETELSLSHKSKRVPGRKNKKFVSVIERGGRVRSRKVSGEVVPLGLEIQTALHQQLDPESELHTDGANWYKFTGFRHESVDHNKTYVRYLPDGVKVHTNSAEGYFSIFKRGLVGTYQHMSEQHLHRYLDEFDFRMSNRARLGVDDEMRTLKALDGVSGKRLTYAELTQ